MTNTKLDALLRQAEQVEKLIKAELEKVSTFGEDKDYENGTVLCWVRNFWAQFLLLEEVYLRGSEV
jgi:hypothetical protein